MGRRDRDERPSIEVVGADPGLTSVQHVSAGPRGPRRDGVRALVVAGGIVALLLVGLALGGDDGSPAAGEPEALEDPADDEETTTTRRRRPTTTRPRRTTTSTTTTTLPVGPVFGGRPLGGWLLTGNTSGWTLVEVDTGARIEVELPFDNPYATRAVSGGVVVLGGDRQAEYYDLRSGAVDPVGVALGPADQAIPATRSDRIWLVDMGGSFEGEWASDSGQARLVDLHGDVLRSFSVPSGYVHAATEDGLLFERGGRIYVADEGGVRPIASGYLIGSTVHRILLQTCDDRAVCGAELRVPGRGTGRKLDLAPDAFEAAYEVSSDETGRFALVVHRNDGGSEVAFFEADGAPAGVLDEPGLYLNGAPSWLPADAGFVAARNSAVVWIHRRDGELVVDELPALDGLTAEGVLVVRP